MSDHDEIYQGCVKHSQVDIPIDLHTSTLDKVFEVQYRIREGMNFCNSHLPLYNKAIAAAKKKLAAAESLANSEIVEAIKSGVYKSSITGFTERKYLLEKECSNKYNLERLKSELDEVTEVYKALKTTQESLKTAKEQLNTAVKAMGDDKLISSQGGAYNLHQGDISELPKEIKF